jgi:hypothetical protein
MNVPIGAPCWFELASADAKRSIPFLEQLYGWKLETMAMPQGEYHFLSNQTGTIGALYELGEEQRKMSVPPHFGVYFLVKNCDESFAKATALGAEVLVPPMSVSDYGRMAVLRDPTGAVFSLWQSMGEAKLVMFENLSLGWTELATRDVPRARAFFAELLGWQYSESTEAMPGGGHYVEYSVAGTRYGGLLPMNEMWAGIPPHWAIYIPVPDIKACVDKAVALGGKLEVPIFEAPGVGQIALLAEPSGAVHYVIQLASSN